MTALLFHWKPIVEILILWFIIYHILIFFEGTRAIHVLRGIIIIICAFFIFRKLNLEVVDWLLTKLFGISVIAALIIFHPEIRQGLARIGQRHLFGVNLKTEEIDVILNEIVNAVETLSKEKVGALIAIENKVSLNPYIEKGVIIDAKISSDLIQTIFTPKSLLHDGALIIRHDRMIAAGCLFPLTDNAEISRIFGTRHRAALGLSEETDATILIVSEERQDMSLVYRSRLHKDLSREGMLSKIKEIMRQKNE